MNPQEPVIPTEDTLSTTATEESAAEAPAAKPRRTRARKSVEALPESASREAGEEPAPLVAQEGVMSAEGAVSAPAKPRRRKPAPAVEAALADLVPDPGQTVDADAASVSAPGHVPVVAIEQPVATTAAPAAQASRDDDEYGEEDDDEDDDEPAAEAVERPEPMDVGEVFAQVLSGEFDVEEVEVAAPPAGPPKRVLLPDPEAPKLHKVLAQAGVGSRRDMEQMIVDGLITVNGQAAHTGQRISFGDQIKVDGKPIRVSIVPPAPRIIAYHKPAGEVVTHDDPQHRPTVFRRLPRLPRGKWQSVGRLDLNTEGLLLFTNSGELANQLMHPRFGVEREYAVRVLGTLESEAKAKLLAGVEIEGQLAGFKSVEDGGGEGVNRWYRVVITEGRNREVRKLFEAVGLTVSRLIRIRYGTVVLPRGLKRGVWVDLASEDVQIIRQLAGGGVQSPRRGRDGRDARDGRDTRNNRRNKPQRGVDGPKRSHPAPDQQQPRFNDRPSQPRQVPAAAAAAVVAGPRNEDFEDDFDPRQIPNPLEQTFDKRFVQNPRSPAGGRGFRHGGGGFGMGGSAPAPAPAKKGGGPREPDPLQTSVGYIGADAFHRKGRGGGGGGGSGSGGGGSGGGGRSGGSRGGGGGYGGGGGGGGGYGGKRGR
ncbi:MAG: pseudouridine synthase [Pseudomonadota bacterium]